MKCIDHFFSKETFEINKTKQEGILKTSPIPKNIETYYNPKAYLSYSGKEHPLVKKLYAIVKNIMIRVKIRLLEKQSISGSLLEIGSGTGEFIRAAKKRGWEVYGVETNTKAIEIARKKNSELKRTKPKNKKHEAVVLWHVLEHIEDIEKEVKDLKRCLKEEGTLFLAVPNYKSLDARFYESYWAAYDVPRHIWHFSKKGMIAFLRKNDLKVKKTKPLFFDAFYVSLLSERYKNKNYLRGLLVGIVSTVFAIFTGEYSSNIFIVKHIKNK